MKESIDAFFESKPYEIVRGMNPDTNEVFGVLRVKRECPRFGVFSSEISFIISVRLSTISYGNWLFTRLGIPPLPLILSSRFSKLRLGTIVAASQSRLKGVGANAKAFIKTLQPFSTGEGTNSPLWHLHELSNFDKHRRICLASAVTHALHIQGVAGEVVGLMVGQQGKLQDGAILMGVRLDPVTYRLWKEPRT